jgi:hypothetical protein
MGGVNLSADILVRFTLSHVPDSGIFVKNATESIFSVVYDILT